MSTVTSRSSRMLVRMPMTLLIGKRATPVQSEEVWSGGLVIRCDVPVSARQLVKFQLQAPPEGTSLTLAAMVESKRAAAGDIPPALVLTLYGNSGPPMDRWSQMLNDIRTRFPDSTQHPVVSDEVSAATPDAVHRRHVRFLAAFDVRARTVSELMTFVTRDVSRGGMFLRTRRSCRVGDEMLMELVHPTTQATFPLLCVVRRRVVDADASGVGVEIIRLDPAREKELWAFVKSGIPDAEEEAVDVDVDVDEGG